MPSPRISWGSSLPDSECAASRRLVAAVVATAPSAIAAITSTAAVRRRRTGVRCSLARDTAMPNGFTDAVAVTVSAIPGSWAWRDYLTQAPARQHHLGVAHHTFSPTRLNPAVHRAPPMELPPRNTKRIVEPSATPGGEMGSKGVAGLIAGILATAIFTSSAAGAVSTPVAVTGPSPFAV